MESHGGTQGQESSQEKKGEQRRTGISTACVLIHCFLVPCSTTLFVRGSVLRCVSNLLSSLLRLFSFVLASIEIIPGRRHGIMREEARIANLPILGETKVTGCSFCCLLLVSLGHHTKKTRKKLVLLWNPPVAGI